MMRAGRELRDARELTESIDERLDLLDGRTCARRIKVFRFLASSSDEASYRSSNSVALVVKLSLVQGAELGAADSSSELSSVVSAGIGADMKWFPLGVGK